MNRVLIAESGSGFGGSAKYLTSLLPLLDSRFNVEIVTYGSGPFIQQLKQEKRAVYFVSKWRFPWRIAEIKTKNALLNKAVYFLGMAVQLVVLVPVIAVWLLYKKVNLIHLNNEILSHLPLLLAGRLVGAQIVCHFHGWRNLISTEKLASRCVNKFIAVTQSGADFYSWQLNGKSVEGIPNGLVIEEREIQPQVRLDTRQKLGLTDNDFMAILIGRFIPLKGHSVFFRALAEAREKNPHIRGVVVGNDPSDKGQYLAKLKSEIKALGIEDYVTFLPWQDHMGPVYQASDVVAQPSIEPESFGYVALEGMAEGKPVIGSRLGGLRDVIKDGETGFLVEAGNSIELASAISRLAKDRSFSNTLGARGKERAKNLFTMEHNAQRITQVYDQLLNSNRILIAESGSGYGGTAKYLTHLLSSIHKNEFSIHIAAYGKGPFIKEIERQWPMSYCSAWRYPWGEKDEVWGKNLTGNSFGQAVKYIFSAAISFFQIGLMVPFIFLWLKRKKIRLVHLNNGIRSHIPLVIAARMASCKLICHFHGWRPFTRTEKWLTPWIDQFITISEAGATFLKSQISVSNITAIPNGLPEKQHDIPRDRIQSERTLIQVAKDANIVSIIGRLVEWKGQEIFLQALAKTLQQYPNTVGIILGHDPTPDQQYLKKLQTAAEQLGISQNIRFLPFQEDVQTIYAISDIVIHASTDPEPFGLVILEAMFAGKPVIATKGGGVSDLIIEGKTGLLVESNDPNKLSAAIDQIISNSKFAHQLGAAAQERAKTFFTIERNAAVVQEIYRDLLSGQKNHSKLKWRSHLKQAMFTSGALSLVRESLSSKVPILMYHKIAQGHDDPFFPAVSESVFRQQMVYVKRHYQVVSLDDLTECLRAGQPLVKHSIAVTFDDGNAATLFTVLPILKELNIPATIFLSSGPTQENHFIWTDLLRLWFKYTKIDRYSIQLNSHVREWKLEDEADRLAAVREISRKLKMMPNDNRKKIMEQLEHDLGVDRSKLPNDWVLSGSQIKYMLKSDLKFGAHTISHPILSRMSLKEARYEIFESKRWLENIISDKVRHFAYPNGEVGDFTQEHEELVAQAGFESAASTIVGLNDSNTNRYALKRIYAAEESLANFASRLVGIGS